MDIWGQCTDWPQRTFTFLVRKCVARWYICHLCFVLQYIWFIDVLNVLLGLHSILFEVIRLETGMAYWCLQSSFNNIEVTSWRSV